MARVTLENIKKIYKGNVTAVHDFNLDIKDKEFVVFVGPSGCGKSTTLRMIAGLEEISEGTLKIDDVVVNDMQPKDREISMVFQNYALYPHLTVFENLAFPLRIAKSIKRVPRTENEVAEIEKQIELVREDIHTLEIVMSDSALVQASEEEIAKKVSPLEEKINANKKLATILEEQKEAREYVEKLAKEAKKLDEEISRLKASIYATNEEGEAQLTDEEIARAEKVINVCTRKLEKIRKRMECPLGESKTQRINDKLNALAYKNVIMEEKITAIKETKSYPVRLAKFKEELERLEREKTEDKPVYCKLSAKEIYERVTNAARILGITEYLNRKPRALSGGQRQRVAIGRAMVKNSKVFLMDEPLSNLDAKLRNQMRAEIILLRNKIDTTFIYVTHDQTEAMTLGDRIVVMKDGFIMQVGTPEEVFDQPANLFVAEFIGAPKMNIVKCKLEEKGGKYTVNPFGVEVPLDGPKGEMLKEKAITSREIYLGVRPEHVNINYENVPHSIPVTVQVNEMMGSEFHLHVVTEDKTQLIVRVPTVELTNEQRKEMVAGKKLFVTFEDKVLHFFDQETEESLLK